MTGKKIKRHKLTAYHMHDSSIKKVEQYGKSNAIPNAFTFDDRNDILFEWNNKANKCPEGLVKEDVVPYLVMPMEITFMDNGG
jgi:hypothetical protein